MTPIIMCIAIAGGGLGDYSCRSQSHDITMEYVKTANEVAGSGIPGPFIVPFIRRSPGAPRGPNDPGPGLDNTPYRYVPKVETQHVRPNNVPDYQNAPRTFTPTREQWLNRMQRQPVTEPGMAIIVIAITSLLAFLVLFAIGVVRMNAPRRSGLGMSNLPKCRIVSITSFRVTK